MLKVPDSVSFRKLAGQALPPSDWMTITQEMIDDFARATGDHQWIHVDPVRSAAESLFGVTIAHGFLSVSLLSKLIMEMVSVESARMGLNYGLNRVRFLTPVVVNSQVRLQTTILSVEDYEPAGMKVTWDCTLELAGMEKPACVAEFITLFFE